MKLQVIESWQQSLDPVSYNLRLCAEHAKEFEHYYPHRNPVEMCCTAFGCAEPWTHYVHIKPEVIK